MLLDHPDLPSASACQIDLGFAGVVLMVILLRILTFSMASCVKSAVPNGEGTNEMQRRKLLDPRKKPQPFLSRDTQIMATGFKLSLNKRSAMDGVDDKNGKHGR